MRGKSLLAGLVGCVVAAALLVAAFQRAGGIRFVAPLISVPPTTLLLALVCEATVQSGKAWKWSGLLAGLRPERRPSFGSALRAVLVGGMATQVIPLRLDEVLRARVLSQREGLPIAAVLGTVALDRAVEIAVLGSLLGVVAAFGGLPGPLLLAVRVAMVAGTLVLGGIGAALLLDHRLPLNSARRGLSRLRPHLRQLVSGLKTLPRGGDLLRVMSGTAAEWAATVAMYVAILQGLGHVVRPVVPLALSVGGAAAYGVPNVPGAIGTYEAAQVGLLEQLVGLPPADALAAALLCHAILTIPITVAGALVLATSWIPRGPRAPAP